jgi:hypothetical protein
MKRDILKWPMFFIHLRTRLDDILVYAFSEGDAESLLQPSTSNEHVNHTTFRSFGQVALLVLSGVFLVTRMPGLFMPAASHSVHVPWAQQTSMMNYPHPQPMNMEQAMEETLLRLKQHSSAAPPWAEFVRDVTDSTLVMFNKPITPVSVQKWLYGPLWTTSQTNDMFLVKGRCTGDSMVEPWLNRLVPDKHDSLMIQKYLGYNRFSPPSSMYGGSAYHPVVQFDAHPVSFHFTVPSGCYTGGVWLLEGQVETAGYICVATTPSQMSEPFPSGVYVVQENQKVIDIPLSMPQLQYINSRTGKDVKVDLVYNCRNIRNLQAKMILAGRRD